MKMKYGEVYYFEIKFLKFDIVRFFVDYYVYLDLLSKLSEYSDFKWEYQRVFSSSFLDYLF